MASNLQPATTEVATVTPAAHRTDIEGLRALAVGLVLLYHAQVPLFGGGFVGVDVFFVISGFLITSSLLREVERTGTIRMAAFYARRARRLLPASALVLVSTAAAVRLLLPATTWRDFGGDIAASAGYAINWRLAWRSVDYLAEDVIASPVQHFWSLAIEEQFYFVWPLLLLAAAVIARRCGWRAPAVMTATLVLVVIVPSLVWSVIQTAANPTLAFFDTGTRMWELGAGGLVAVMGLRQRLQPRAATAAKAIAVLAIVSMGMLLDKTVPWPGLMAASVVVPTAALLWLGGSDDVVGRTLSRRPMQRVGAWSYSLYLWHWPPLAILAARWNGLTTTQAVLIVLASVAPAVAAHHLIENPVRYAARLKGAPGRTLRLGAALSVAGLMAGVLVVVAVPGKDGSTTLALAQPVSAPTKDPASDMPTPPVGPVGAAILRGWTNPTDDAMLALLAATSSITPPPTLAVDDLPQVYPDRCHAPAFSTDEVTVCRYGDPTSEVHVALVGDSKAGQWGDTLQLVAERRGWRLTYMLKSTCELTTAMPDRDGPFVACQFWGTSVLDLLAADPPDVVLTSQVSGGAYAEPGEDAVQLQIEGMLDAYDQLRASGSEPVILLDNNQPGMNIYECVSTHLDDLAACSFDRSRPTQARPTQQAVADIGGYATIDLADHICPTQTCMPVIGNVLVYRQGSHISNTYARTLVDVLDERLSPLVEAYRNR
jgi:peptidoglycan/LPS O-acetylase OafA/YrhL